MLTFSQLVVILIVVTIICIIVLYIMGRKQENADQKQQNTSVIGYPSPQPISSNTGGNYFVNNRDVNKLTDITIQQVTFDAKNTEDRKQNPLIMLSVDNFQPSPKISQDLPLNGPVSIGIQQVPKNELKDQNPLTVIPAKNFHPSPRLPIRLNIIDPNKEKEVDVTPVIDRHYTEELNVIARGNSRPGFESKGEVECRRILHKLFRKPFPRCRPSFLVNPKSKRRLELDCYNEELGIAVEYNGEHHYKWPAWPKITYEQFMDQLDRDQLKLDMCDNNGIYLVVVPYTVKQHMIGQFILDKMMPIINFKKIKVYPIK